MFSSVALVFLSALVAYFLYIKRHEKVDRVVSKVKHKSILKASRSLLFIDHFYTEKIVLPFKEVTQALWLFIDVAFIDSFFNSLSRLSLRLGSISSDMQNGKIQTYITIFVSVLALVLIGTLFLWVFLMSFILWGKYDFNWAFVFTTFLSFPALSF